ncbi:MAG: S24 family peptidase [Acidobacteriota bacterium]|nr:S24 family peptidase [Acidobacteriota bacterium]
MQCKVTEVYAPDFLTRLSLPLFGSRVAAGFPSPADDYIEGRIDLNKELIRHPSFTFCVRVQGDSMETTIRPNELLIVDRMPETRDDDIIVAWYEGEFCVKRLKFLDDGSIWLYSDNRKYKPMKVAADSDFEIWGLVLHTVQSFRRV